MYNKGDLHIHSNYSDGKFSINDLLDMYKKNGYDIVSITEHDTKNNKIVTCCIS